MLLLTFGSLVAAGLPIITAIFGVALGITGVTAMTAFMDIGSSTPMLATMIGLAVGIDYTLFILARYRTELQHTDDREQAVGIAVGTAGSAVVFAGLTVLIALSALAVVRIPFLTAMGLAAAATVLIAVLVALTLLPAILGMLSPGRSAAGSPLRAAPRARRPRPQQRRALGPAGRPPRRSPSRCSSSSASAPWRIPLKDLHLAFPTDSTAPSDTTQRQASDLMAERVRPRPRGPAAGRRRRPRHRRGRPRRRVRRGRGWAAGQDDVANAQVVAMNEAGTGAQIMVTPGLRPGRHRDRGPARTTCATARPASRPRPARRPASPA